MSISPGSNDPLIPLTLTKEAAEDHIPAVFYICGYEYLWIRTRTILVGTRATVLAYECDSTSEQPRDQNA